MVAPNIPGIDNLQRLGSGASGTVWAGREVDLDRQVAVKVLRVLDNEAYVRFEQERRAMGRLTNVSGVAPVFRSGVNQNNEPFIVMRLYQRSLQDLLKQRGPLAVGDATTMMETIAAAIMHTHHMGILHLDIKPSNILLTSGNEPHLSDFGIAEIMGNDAKGPAAMLTPAYAAPERFEGAPSTVATDIYSLGATFYAMLTARPPFQASSSTGALIKQVINDPVDLRPLPSEAMPRLGKVLETALAKDPNDRFQSAEEFTVALAPSRPEQTVQRRTAAPNPYVHGTSQRPATTPATSATYQQPTPQRPANRPPNVVAPASAPSKSGKLDPTVISVAVLASVLLGALAFLLWFNSGSSDTNQEQAVQTDTSAADENTTTEGPSEQDGGELGTEVPDLNIDLDAVARQINATLSRVDPQPFPDYQPPTATATDNGVTISGHIQFQHELDAAIALAGSEGVSLEDAADIIAIEDTFTGRYIGMIEANSWASKIDKTSGFGGAANTPSRIRCLIELNSDLWRVPCALPHNFAIEQTISISDADYPGEEELRTRGSSRCEADKTDQIFVPTEQEFAAGLRELHCANRYGNGFFTLDSFGEFSGEAGEFTYTGWLQSNGFSQTISLGDAASATCVVRLSPTGLDGFFELNSTRRFSRTSQRLIVPCWMPHVAEATGGPLAHTSGSAFNSDVVNRNADAMCRAATEVGAGLGVVGSSADQAEWTSGDLAVRCVVHEVNSDRWVVASREEALAFPQYGPTI